MFAHFQFVHWRAGEQVAKCLYAFNHFPAQFFLGDFLHRAGDELQIGVESDLELHLVPDVGKQRPRIIVDEFIEHFFIREFDQPPTGMIGREIFATELPQCGVQVADIDNVAGGICYFNAVAHAKRLTDQNVNPSNEAFNRRLQSQPDNDRTDAERSDSRIPIHKNYRYNDQRDGQPNGEAHDTLECETSGRVLDAAKPVDGKRTRDSQHDRDQRTTPQNSLSNANSSVRQRYELRANNKVNDGAHRKNSRVSD